jgi:lysophospholipase L1-like esterase
MRRVLACGLLLAATVVAVRAGPAHADGLRISVFGDSVLLGASEEISAALAGNDVTVDARENVSLLGALGTLDAARPGIGDVVVLDLGYNDGADPGVWRDRVDRALAILAGVPKVIWLSQAVFADGRAAMNAELAAAVSRFPNLEVVDWAATVAARPDLVYGDGIHLTPAGQQAMADMVRARVDAFVAARVAATSTTITTTTSTTTTTTSTTTTTAVVPASTRGDRLEARRAEQGRTITSDDDDGRGDGGWLVAGFAAVVLGAGAFVAWRAFGRPDAPE